MQTVRLSDCIKVLPRRYLVMRSWAYILRDVTYTPCKVCGKMKLPDDQKQLHKGVCHECRKKIADEVDSECTVL